MQHGDSLYEDAWQQLGANRNEERRKLPEQKDPAW